jgi:hypothetical protein
VKIWFGRKTVDEFLKLAKGVLDLFGKTHLSPKDQSKINQLFSDLNANDELVDQTLHPRTESKT